METYHIKVTIRRFVVDLLRAIIDGVNAVEKILAVVYAIIATLFDILVGICNFFLTKLGEKKHESIFTFSRKDT